MVGITIELIRKRSEHNEGEISTLEEISLHQENIDKIELLDKACRNLKILLLQYNLISKIENLQMLKKLEYLNLALNNIEAIENLEGLESLKKLDLTVNFIGDLRGIKSLRRNENLEQLFLTGNPCTDYEGYREYVVATLPQLKELDMVEILRSERIKALQVCARAEGDVIRGYENYKRRREEQKARNCERLRISKETRMDEVTDDETENEKFWKQKSYHTPEDRVAIADRVLEREEKRNESSVESNKLPKFVPKLFNADGKPYNMNQAKVPFKLNDEDDPNNIVLDIEVYRYLDTSYINVDVQPSYARVTIKGKILQLTLPCEVSMDKSIAKRNVTTGNLLVIMPRLTPLTIIGKKEGATTNNSRAKRNSQTVVVKRPELSRRQYLEIGPAIDDLDFSKIVENSRKGANAKQSGPYVDNEKPVSTDFIDDPDVPPLE